MFRSRLTTNLPVVALLLATGCTSLPRWPFPWRESSLSAASEQQVPVVSADPARALGQPTSEIAAGADAGKTGRSPLDPAQSGAAATGVKASASVASGSADLEQFVAELDGYPEIDPAKRTEMIRLLIEAEPWLQGKLIRQYRASLIFARQTKQRAATPSPPESAQSLLEPAARTVRTDLNRAGSAGESFPSKSETGLTDVAPSGQADLAEALIAALHRTTPATLEQARPAGQVAPSRQSDVPPERGIDGSVVRASHEVELPADWQARLDGAIEALESNVHSSPQSPEEAADDLRLHMLYLAAGRRDDAMRPIPSLESPLSDFWSEEFFGLGTLIDTALISDPANRAAEAKGHFNEAVDWLGESAPLVVRNLAFITDVQSYGVYEQFDKYEFTANQRVLLYAEVENFKSQENARGFHTGLKSSYQIFDGRGRRVADHEFTVNEEYCRNRRRDFFIGYEFTLPEKIYSGKHTLQLTVADLNSQKVGQSTIEFYIKTPDE